MLRLLVYGCAMPGWVVSVVLAIAVALLIAALGSTEAVTIFALMLAWFVVVGGVALGVETLLQRARRRRR
jgi:ABC-type transport system involved in cytochrome bd biosynthesis fused ATPase/permease subunit